MSIRVKIVEKLVEYRSAHMRSPSAIVITPTQIKELIMDYSESLKDLSLGHPMKNGEVGTLYGCRIFVSDNRCPCGIKLTDEHKPICLAYQVNGIRDAIWLGDIDA